WVIGCCMIVMAVLVKLPLPVNAAIGIIIIAAHNLIDPRLWQIVDGLNSKKVSGLWKILYIGFYAGPVQFGPDGPNLIVLYSLIPWVGVMAAGYAFGKILTLAPDQRNKTCVVLSLGAIALFLILRGFNIYGDPRPWHRLVVPGNGGTPMPGLLSFLNCTKYP